MIDELISLALTLPATIYGLGELRCGDTQPVTCVEGRITASGEVFNPEDLTGAVPAPANRRVRGDKVVCLLSKKGAKVFVRITDKSNERWIGKRGLDLTPGTWKALGYEPHSYLSDKVTPCDTV